MSLLNNKFFSYLISSIILFILIKYSSNQMLGIDMGSEYFKVCMTLPHQNKYHMVENLQSKIKTNSVIFLKNTDRIYETEAINKRIKNPKNSLSFLSKYLGITENPDSYFEKYFFNYDYEFDNKTSSINFKVKFVNEKEEIKDTNFPLEALYGILFRYIKKISEKYYNENFNENSNNKFYTGKAKIEYCFVTVPSFYTYKQRLSIIQAVSLSNMQLVGLTNDNTAAAIYYYKSNFNLENFNVKNENATVNFIFINIGSSYTQLSLIGFSKTEMKILGEVYDKDLGGHLFTRNLVIKIIEKFGLKKDINIYNKIYPYADKYKENLSANKEVHMNFVIDNKNYNGIITRDEFNKINKDEFNRIPNLLDELFKKTNMTFKDINQYELIGGSIRIPEIQNIIKEYVGEEINDLVGTHLNGDDSIAFGAVYAIRWRKKPIGDGNQYNISIDITSLDNTTILLNKTEIFKRGSGYESEKKIGILLNKNLKLNIYEEDNIIFTCVFNNIENEIKKFINNYIQKNKNVTYSKIPKINFEFYLSKLGKLSLNANLIYNVRTYIGLNTTNNSNNIIYSLDYIPPLSKEEINNLKNELNNTNLTYVEKDTINKKLKIGTFYDNDIPIKLNYKIIDNIPKSLTDDDLKFWKEKLDFYDKREAEEIKILELRNEIESLLYEKQNFLESNEAKEFTKDTEYHGIENIVKDTRDWFEDEGGITRNITLLSEKINELNKIFEKITKRINEKKERDIAYEKFNVEIKNNQKNFEKKIKYSKPWTEFYYDDVYIPEVSRLSQYLREKYEKQNKLKAYEDSILQKDEIEEAHKIITDLFEKLNKIPTPIHSPKYENIKLQDLYRHNKIKK